MANHLQACYLPHLAYKGSHFSALVTTSRTKIPMMVDFEKSNYTTNTYHLFTTCSPCPKNLKVRITNRSLSPVTGIWSTRILNSISQLCTPFPKLVL